MLSYIEGDIFSSPAQVLVNTVNTVGVMGKGLALSFKQRYPKMFEAYRSACEKKQLRVGKLMLWYEPDHWILMFPTKENWRYPSRLEYIEKGLATFVRSYAEKQITSIAFPKLGCGNGELSWDDVRPIMEKYLSPLPIDVYVYLGLKDSIVPEHKNPKDIMEWLKKNAKDMSFDGIKDEIMYISALKPHEFAIDNQVNSLSWDNGLRIHNENTKDDVFIEEEAFFKLWDNIRNRGIFITSEADKKANLVYAVLESLGYLSEIRIKDYNTGKLIDGYQINAGSGRMFDLGGGLS